ncbi:hypothetical protein FEP67_03526 [Burkholderia multivorans]|nr:hypothetical protein [Burkholderia multivorans]MDR9065835.1 hypothetical protein [Burkholderia multivorans]
MPSAIRFETSRNSAEICARIWFGASVCIAAVDVGIGNDAKNIAITSMASDAGSASSCVNSVAGTIMHAAPIAPARIGASTRPRRSSQSLSQPPQNTPAVFATSNTMPSV